MGGSGATRDLRVVGLLRSRMRARPLNRRLNRLSQWRWPNTKRALEPLALHHKRALELVEHLDGLARVRIAQPDQPEDRRGCTLDLHRLAHSILDQRHQILLRERRIARDM